MSISSKYHCDLSESQVLAGEQVLLSVHFLASGLISLARIIYIGFWTAFTGEAALAISVTKYVDLSYYLFSPWFPLAESCSQWELLDNREIKGVTHSPFHPLFFFYDKTTLNHQYSNRHYPQTQAILEVTERALTYHHASRTQKVGCFSTEAWTTKG